MKIFVKAKPGAKKTAVGDANELLGKTGEIHLIVSVKEPAKEGRANRAIERALAEYFKVPPSRVRIVAGHASREKVVEIGGAP